jgi:rare lipoprotein A (peptidoglycan hydrolase)
MKKIIMVGLLGMVICLFSSTGWAYLVKASWYGKYFHGKTAANGKPYNMYSLTAAHKTLPLGTKVKIINPKNGQSIIVEITDRGPYIFGREIDLSYGAAKKIGLIKNGVELIKIKILEKKSPFYLYRIKKRETLWRLFGQNWSIIARLNKISPQRIKQGMKIIVPYYWDEVI